MVASICVARPGIKLTVVGIAVMCVAALSSCVAKGSLPSVVKEQPEQQEQLWLSAPYIVAGRIDSLVCVGSTFGQSLIFGAPSAPVRRCRLNLFVERTLQGTLPQREQVSILGVFLDTTAYLGAKPYMWEVGDRRLFFLRAEGDEIRLFSDVYGLDVSLASGSRDKLEFQQGDSTGDKILRSLLVPATDADLTVMAETIRGQLPKVAYLGSPRVAVELLSSLVVSRSPKLAEAACVALSQQYPGMDACLEQLGGTGSRAIDELWASHSRRIEQLVAELSNRPLMLRGSNRVDYELQVLEMLARHPEGRVRQLACQALAKCSPDSSKRAKCED